MSPKYAIKKNIDAKGIVYFKRSGQRMIGVEISKLSQKDMAVLFKMEHPAIEAVKEEVKK